MKFAHRMRQIIPSATMAITAKANELNSAGVKVISFSAGEPDFDTPISICQAAKQAIDTGKTRYTTAAGMPVLRAAIAADYAKRGRTVDATEVLVSSGGKHALYNAMQVLFQEGDRVLIPQPNWVTYPAQVKLTGADPIFIDCTAVTQFKITPSQLRTALETDETIRGLILCSPANPTGAVYSQEELEALGNVLLEYPDVVVFFDAMYDRLSYQDDIAPDLVATVHALDSQVLTFNGMSKTYAMTGWRIGYTIGPTEVIAEMAKLQSQSTSNPMTIAQYATLSALELPDAEIHQMRDIYQKRRDLMVNLLREIPQVTCDLPMGAFYAFPSFAAYVGAGKAFADDLALASFLLEEAHVAVVPGSAFGAPGYLRLSYATSEDEIREGIGRMKDALARKM